MQLVVVIGTPVDEFLGPSMTIFEKAVDQIAPHLRDGALVVLRSTVYPGTTGYVAQHLAERGCTRGRRLLPGADRRGPRARGAPLAAPDHRRRRRPSRPSARRRCSATLASKTIRTTTKEAELAKLFTNTWRYMKFAVANQFFMIADQAGVDYTNVLRAIREDYPRAADLPGPGLRRRPVPVQGHDAAGRLHRRPLPARPGRDAGQRGPARLHRLRARAPLRRAAAARRSGSSGWPSRPSPTTRARRSATSCASCCRGPAPASWPPTRTSTTTAS